MGLRGVRLEHLCEAEAPTEVVAETVVAVMADGGRLLLEIEAYLANAKIIYCKHWSSRCAEVFAGPHSYDRKAFF